VDVLYSSSLLKYGSQDHGFAEDVGDREVSTGVVVN
jgi:hypothetical protein